MKKENKMRLKTILIGSALSLSSLYVANYLISQIPKPTVHEKRVETISSIKHTSDLVFLVPNDGIGSAYGCFQLADLDHNGKSDSLIKRVSSMGNDTYGCNTYNNTAIEATNLLTTLNNIDYEKNSNMSLRHFKSGRKPVKIKEDTLLYFQQSARNRVAAQLRFETRLLDENK